MASKRKKYTPEKWPEKAYKNLNFITSPEGRTIRVLAEFLEPAARFRKQNVRNTVVFFGSARTLRPDRARANLRQVKREAAGLEKLSRAMKKQL